MSFPTATTWSWVAAAMFLLLAISIQQRKKYARLPPRPTPLPIVGNIFDFPRIHLGREFAVYTKHFGDVVHLDMLGKNIIVLGSLKAARDLLDKRSANYSDRPTSVMLQLLGYDWLTSLMNYGSRWRQHRRAMHPAMTPDVLPQYEATQAAVARNFLRILLHNPQDLASHIKFTIAAVYMGTIYGIEIREPDDKHYRMVERMGEVAEAATIPGNFPVEAFPTLRYLPSWFPGGGFKKWAADANRDIAHTVSHLFDGAKDVAAKDPSRRSMVNRMLGASASQGDQAAELEKMCKEIAATLYVGAADTSNAIMGAFFLAMALYPEAQKRAQKELDAVVGAERFPVPSDRPSLPYVNALVKELFRWHLATPIGAPHRVVADDEYNGYLIPGGATVFVNMWAILRDPEVYSQPDDFMPERFLDSDGNLDVQGRDPTHVMFGFGRRLCPGRYFAESTLFILCASVLSAFAIGPPVDHNGIPAEVRREATDGGMVAHPKIHKYSIRPRSPHVERLVEIPPSQ
ncbi:hypothetical protein V8D89_000352 [Ganoderma adspersum]